MSHVDIGFVEKIDKYLLKSHYFPSKIGGKPSWLSLRNLPTIQDSQCSSCSAPLIFLAQIYAPFEEDPENFHRTIFVFICRNPTCSKSNDSSGVRVWRSQLRRDNDFYSSEPPNDDETDFNPAKFVTTCHLCGCRSEKHCSKCKVVSYCSREHQVADWKAGHKTNCGHVSTEYANKTIYDEWNLVIEEEDERGDEKSDENEQMRIYETLVKEGKAGTLDDVSEEELQSHADIKEDKAFSRFKKTVDKNPDQVLRYDRGGEPLWIAAEPKPSSVPNCEYCGSERRFEFQILPQLLYVLHEDKTDFGTLLIYTCKKSCTTEPDYKSEYVFKQDVSS